MSNANPAIPADGTITPYPSLFSLREAHSQLLKDYRTSETDEIFDQIENFVRRAKATGALLDADHDRVAGQSLLDYWMTFLYRAKRNPPEATLAEFDSSLAPTLDDGLCPYKGLEAFAEKDKDVFFGRQHLIEKMVSHLSERRLL